MGEGASVDRVLTLVLFAPLAFTLVALFLGGGLRVSGRGPFLVAVGDCERGELRVDEITSSGPCGRVVEEVLVSGVGWCDVVLGGVVGRVGERVVVLGVIGGEVGEHYGKCWGLGEDLFKHGRRCRGAWAQVGCR